jgi:membrane-anchored mycosin MYCP
VKRISRFLATATLVSASFVVSTPPAVAAPPAGACNNPDPARPAVREQPWAQQFLDAKAVGQHSTGAGVVVAVIDSGVDADHPQLRQPGKVLAGQDFFLVGDLPGNFDCVSHGTAVAGIIAAEPVDGVGFAGLAPDARILPVRVSERDLNDEGAAETIDPAVLARGIWYAADNGADVINLSVAGAVDNIYVRDAIAHAVSKDVVVVAAAGNGQQGTAAGPKMYPAAYDGVLGVGAIDMAGARVPSSRIGPHVDLVAPGDGVLGATRVGGHQYWQGTSFATPFVSATAALVRSAWPQLSAAEVAERILATTTPAPGGTGSDAYGAGIVNPYRAVTDGLVTAPPAALPAVAPAPPDPQQARIAAWWDRASTGGRTAGVLASSAVVLGLLLALVFSRGRRSRWQARLAAPVPAEPVRDELPEEMFLLPAPTAER